MIMDDHFEAGIQLRREMFGQAAADDQVFATTGLNDKLQEIVTRWCYAILCCGIPAGGEALRVLDTVLSEDGRDSVLREPATHPGHQPPTRP
jgi:hypothetical protein